VYATALWPDLEQRRVLLAVSGGVAAYKAAELCRLLTRCGAQVRVMMTEAARQFVGEATFAALSGQPVATELFNPVQEAQIGHIRLADEAEALVVAPATADVLAKLAHGLATDVVTTVYLAFRGPVLLAPAMNVQMWQHAATRSNVALLRQRGGHRMVGPESGEMACGHVGAGRMSEPEQILQAVGACLCRQDLAETRLMVTAGPTREAIDPVRFLANRSSGKMGYAVAAEAAARGAEVTLVSGPTALPVPSGVRRVDVSSAAQMAQAVQAEAGQQDVLIMAAAVADYRVRAVASEKLKKAQLGQTPTLELERTEDILQSVARLSYRAGGRTLVVGFGAETASADLQRLATEKLASKGCDLLVVNDVSQSDAGFEVDTNRIVVAEASGRVEASDLRSKRQIARQILDRVVALRQHGVAEQS